MTYAAFKFIQRDAKVTAHVWNWQDLVEGFELHLTNNADESRTMAYRDAREQALRAGRDGPRTTRSQGCSSSRWGSWTRTETASDTRRSISIRSTACGSRLFLRCAARRRQSAAGHSAARERQVGCYNRSSYAEGAMTRRIALAVSFGVLVSSISLLAHHSAASA